MKYEITEKISYIPSCDSPLSADVAIIKGNSTTYIFDVGNGQKYIDEIQAISGEKLIIISHFHPDHMGNLESLPDIPCLVGSNTFKYAKRGEIVKNDLYIEDGIKFHIFPLPSSHAKGSLGLEINEELAFVGDAIGPAIKPGKLLYNAQLLFEEIRILEKLKASKFFLSHQMDNPRLKEVVLRRLNTVYAKRNGNEPYIEIEGWDD